MDHPWFEDVDWDQVLNKTQQPPLQPNINSCYFENYPDPEDGEDATNYLNSSMYRSALPGARSAQRRRESYYIHSTVQL